MTGIRLDLPDVVRVRITESDNRFCAELYDLDAFTEADSLDELQDMINDLIFELYDVPRAFQHKIRYIPENSPDFSQSVKSMLVMATPDVFRCSQYVHC